MKYIDHHSHYGWGDEPECYAVLHRQGGEDTAVILVRYLLEDWLWKARQQLPHNSFLEDWQTEQQYQWDNHLERSWRVLHLPAAREALHHILETLADAGKQEEHGAAMSVLHLVEDALSNGGGLYLSEDEDYLRCDVIPVIGPDGRTLNAREVEENREENRCRDRNRR